MGSWAPLPDEIDLPRYEEIQQEWNQRDCPDGVMSRLGIGSRVFVVLVTK